MCHRDLAGLMLASTLITLDGTATTVALAAIGRDLEIPISRLQWIGNAPLLMLAALLLPAGALADRNGRVRMIRIGAAGFAASSFACAAAHVDVWLIAARFVQGAAGALLLPAVLAQLRAACKDEGERTRQFGVWAAWIGMASAAGPFLGGGLVDWLSWRAVFIGSGCAGLIAVFLLMRMPSCESDRKMRFVPIVPTVALVGLLGTVAFVLIEGTAAVWERKRVVFASVIVVGLSAVLVHAPKRRTLLPRELLGARNCVPANVATFGFYFGLFGLSFLLALYTQQILGYSGMRTAAVLLPVSAMLLLAERFGRVAACTGTRLSVLAGSQLAAGGLTLIGAAPHLLPSWLWMLVGTTLVGVGISLAASPLTHAAVSTVPESCAGAASGLHHVTVRAAGLLAIAVLGSLAAPDQSQAITVEGFQRGMMTCAAIVAAGGLAGGLLLKNDAPGGFTSVPCSSTRGPLRTPSTETASETTMAARHKRS